MTKGCVGPRRVWEWRQRVGSLFGRPNLSSNRLGRMPHRRRTSQDQRESRAHARPWTRRCGSSAGVALVSLPISSGLLICGWWGWAAWSWLGPIAKVRVGSDGVDRDNAAAAQVVTFSESTLRSIRLVPDEGETGFAVDVIKRRRKARFEGEDARRVAAAVVPRINGAGGLRRTVQKAVEQIEADGHPDRFLRRVARDTDRGGRGAPGSIRALPHPTKLALEMALHEEQERRALEGELWILEQAWKEAEEIAAISDSLLVPAGTEAFFARHGV